MRKSCSQSRHDSLLPTFDDTYNVPDRLYAIITKNNPDVDMKISG